MTTLTATKTQVEKEIVQEPDDESYRKIKHALSSMRLLTPQQQIIRARELELKEKELGHEKFQEWLVKQAGLN